MKQRVGPGLSFRAHDKRSPLWLAGVGRSLAVSERPGKGDPARQQKGLDSVRLASENSYVLD